MIKKIVLGMCFVCMAALIGAGAATAGTVGATSQLLAAQPAAIHSLTSSAVLFYGSDDDSKDKDKDHDKDRDHGHDGDKDDRKGNSPAPSPTPEPSTLLSFGAAILIGSGVYFLGRLRKVQK